MCHIHPSKTKIGSEIPLNIKQDEFFVTKFPQLVLKNTVISRYEHKSIKSYKIKVFLLANNG